MKQARGFALLTPHARKVAAARGGRAAAACGRAFRWTPEQARAEALRAGEAHTRAAAERRANAERDSLVLKAARTKLAREIAILEARIARLVAGKTPRLRGSL